MKKTKFFAFITATLLTVSFAAAFLSACGNKTPQTPTVEYYRGNVFQLVTSDLDDKRIDVGSGFVFSKDGWFITTASVMDGAFYADAVFAIDSPNEGKTTTTLPIENVMHPADSGVFIGKISNYSKIARHYQKIGFATSQTVGDDVYAVNLTENGAVKITEGKLVEDVSIDYDEAVKGVKYLSSSAAIDESANGGVLVNSQLQVLGLTCGTVEKNEESVTVAISAFSFQDETKNVSGSRLSKIDEVIHPDMATFAAFYKNVKRDTDFKKGKLEDGTIYYYYTDSDSGINDDGVRYTYSDVITVAANGRMGVLSEYKWANGDVRDVQFIGGYSEEVGFRNFIYDFRYTYGGTDELSGIWYEIYCDDINYNADDYTQSIEKWQWDSNDDEYIIDEYDVEYAQETFNIYYEWLDGVMHWYD